MMYWIIRFIYYFSTFVCGIYLSQLEFVHAFITALVGITVSHYLEHRRLKKEQREKEREWIKNEQ